MDKREAARIPSLDGLRAVSISLVVIGHIAKSYPAIHRLPAIAHLGVRVFFVISGFLITSLLLKEEEKTGTISLRHFYFRRTLRIFPPFYFYVGLVALGAAFGLFHLHRYDLAAALTYTTNYHREGGWDLGHAWSLAVEEQFYLLWPFLVKFLGSARAGRLAIATIILCPLLRLGLLMFAPSFRAGIGYTFPTVADAIATGCVIAIYRSQLAASPRLVAFLRHSAFWGLAVLAVAAEFGPSTKLHCLLWESVSNICAGLLIWRFVTYQGDRAAWFLNLRPVVFLGVLSYSLYLWQQPFFDSNSTLVVAHFPLSLVAAFAMALCSYYLVERPALQFRTRLERRLWAAPATPAAPELSTIPMPPA